MTLDRKLHIFYSFSPMQKYMKYYRLCQCHRQSCGTNIYIHIDKRYTYKHFPCTIAHANTFNLFETTLSVTHIHEQKWFEEPPRLFNKTCFFFCYYFNWCFWFACWAQRNITYTESFENGVNSELQLGIGNKESTKTNGVHNIMHNSHNICDVHISNVSKFSFFAFKYLLTEPTTCRLIFI